MSEHMGGHSPEAFREATIEAKNEHLDGIVAVAQDVFPQDFDFGKGFDAAKCREMFERALSDPNEFVTVHLGHDKKPVALAFYVNKPPTNGVIMLEMTGVLKDMQGRGIGRRFLQESDALAVKEFREKRGIPNVATIMLTTSADNEVAQKLYLGSGYEHVGNIPGMVGTGNTELVMLKRVGDVSYRPDLWTKPKE